MIELLEGIQSEWKGSNGDDIRNTLISLHGDDRLFVQEAPTGTKFPHVIYDIPAMAAEYTLTSVTHDLVDVQFSVFTNEQSPKNVILLRDKIRDLYDAKYISLDGTWRVVTVYYRSGFLLREPDDKGWAMHVAYEYRIGE